MIKVSNILEFKSRIELVQDLEFPTASSRIRASQDGAYIGATGVYPPQFRLFDTAELSMKHSRGLDAEVVQFQFLSDDYKKLVFLCDNRNVEFHAQYGKHYITRVPKFGRDMVYNPFNTELYIVGATNETYRLNLEQGRFLAPMVSELSEELNVTAFNKSLKYVLANGGDDGLVEIWDLRSKSRTALLDSSQGPITALDFDTEGMTMGVGHNSGLVEIYDIRYPAPVYTVQHNYRLPIKSIKFHPTGKYFFSADPKLIKITNKSSGAIHTSIESGSDIHDVEIVGSSGLILVANEAQRVGTYYIPSVGLAPRWASFLENLTEELEETKDASQNQDWKFVTMEELEQLNAKNMIGSESVQAYMHGYMMEMKLYYKLKLLSEPFDYDQYRKERVKQKLEEKRSERITVRNKLPKVNKELASEILAQKEQGSKKKQVEAERLLSDERFKNLFTDEKFKVDMNSEEYRKKNTKLTKKRDKSMPQEQPEVPESEESDIQSEDEILPTVRTKRPREDNEPESELQGAVSNRSFKEQLKELSKEAPKQVKKRKESKLFKEKPDLKGRRTAISIHKLLK